MSANIPEESLDDIINRRVDVENFLISVYAGKRPLPSARDCFVLAVRLGTPKPMWSEEIKNHVFGESD